jgi:phenylacetate-CoA ligase
MAQRLKVAVDRSLKREVYVDCIKRSDEDLAEIVALIRDLRPHAIVAFASAAATLSRYVARTGARTWATIPVLCGAEQLSAPDRESIQHAFGPAVFDTYGSRETMLIASECEAHDGLHTHSENVVVEVIVFDGERQRAAHEGETGHIVVTDLHNHAMPFIRYANGDLGRIRKAGRCDCGRSLPRIEAVEGRVTDTLRDGKGRPVGGLVVLTMMVPIAHAVTQFQAVQHKDASLTFKLVPTSTFDDAARKHVVTTLEKYLPGIPVTLQLVHDIPLSAGGKRRVVIVE